MAYNQGPGGYYPQQQFGTAPYPDQSQQYQQQPQHQHPQQQQYPAQTNTSTAFDENWHQSVEGISYSITNRDTNAILNVRLPPGVGVKAKSGAMIQMSPSIQLQGKLKFSIKKMFTGSELSESTYTGPGEVSLAPTLFGDISTIPINGQDNWNVGKDAYLASTRDVVRENKTQGLGKALFSGEDAFVYRISGNGTLWVTSFGAIVMRDASASSSLGSLSADET